MLFTMQERPVLQHCCLSWEFVMAIKQRSLQSVMPCRPWNGMAGQHIRPGTLKRLPCLCQPFRLFKGCQRGRNQCRRSDGHKCWRAERQPLQRRLQPQTGMEGHTQNQPNCLGTAAKN